MSDKNNRCYDNNTCPYHDIINDRTNKALPRWVFLSAFGAFITVAVIFAGWHVSSLNAFDGTYKAQVVEFNRLAMENKELLIELRTNQKELIKKLDHYERYNR